MKCSERVQILGCWKLLGIHHPVSSCCRSALLQGTVHLTWYTHTHSQTNHMTKNTLFKKRIISFKGIDHPKMKIVCIASVFFSFIKLYINCIFFISDQKEFQTIITVQGVLGETPLVLKVNGSGSFDESFVSPKSDTWHWVPHIRLKNWNLSLSLCIDIH